MSPTVTPLFHFLCEWLPWGLCIKVPVVGRYSFAESPKLWYSLHFQLYHGLSAAKAILSDTSSSCHLQPSYSQFYSAVILLLCCTYIKYTFKMLFFDICTTGHYTLLDLLILCAYTRSLSCHNTYWFGILWLNLNPSLPIKHIKINLFFLYILSKS